MIARLRLLLPFEVHLRSDQKLAPIRFDRAGYRITIHPPFQSKVDHRDLAPQSPVPVLMINQQLEPADPQSSTSFIRFDGVEVVVADLLQIDFQNESFDRNARADDPPRALGFAVANEFLARLRILTRGSVIKPLAPFETITRLTYLTDNGLELTPAPPLVRVRVTAAWHAHWLALTQASWDELAALPADYQPHTWDTLILDAIDVLPEAGAALVLANTALETRIADALDRLAGPVNQELWEWINDRGDYRKEPSVSEQYDTLMHALTGHSLKENGTLWKAFGDLRKARNAFAHEGKAMLDGNEVSSRQANHLINQAQEIIDWVEGFLPEEARRPQSKVRVDVSVSKLVAGPAAEPPPAESS